jgi:signal transduction histidine kinase
LPTETIVLHREPSPWESYKKYVVGIIAIILAQCALITLLVVQVRRRKRSEGAIRQLSRRLLSASEVERKHIARELHDDIGQRISLVAVDLALFDNQLLSHNDVDHSKFNEPRQQLDAIISDIHLLSHELHSSKLEYLGLAVTLRELSRQIANRHDLTVNCETISSDIRLPSEISLCFYRIAQEAFANIVKHSHATHIQLTLMIESGRLNMTVKDNGMGFDRVDVTPGLGLITMQERLGMIGGTLSVVSGAAVGTQIVAEVKISSE